MVVALSDALRAVVSLSLSTSNAPKINPGDKQAAQWWIVLVLLLALRFFMPGSQTTSSSGGRTLRSVLLKREALMGALVLSYCKSWLQ